MGHITVLFQISWGTSTVLFHGHASLPTVHKHFFFSTSSITAIISYIFSTSHSKTYELISLLLLFCISLIISDAEPLVIYLLIILIIYVLLVEKFLYFKDVAYVLLTIFQYIKLSCLPIYQQRTNRKWNKENNPIYYYYQKKIKHLEINLSNVLKDLYKTFKTLIREILKKINICKVRLSIQCVSCFLK